MPIFEYVCEKCGRCYEYLTFSSNEPLPPCPQCHSKKVKKLMSAGCVRPHGIPTGSGGFKQPACAPSSGG